VYRDAYVENTAEILSADDAQVTFTAYAQWGWFH